MNLHNKLVKREQLLFDLSLPFLDLCGSDVIGRGASVKLIVERGKLPLELLDLFLCEGELALVRASLCVLALSLFVVEL